MTRHCNLLIGWLVISLVAGLGLSEIPWGNPGSFHGKGMPVPVEIWDHLSGREELVDFPNPYGVFLNMGLVFLGGWALWWLARLLGFRRKQG